MAIIIDFDMRGVGNELKTQLLAVPIYQRSYSWGEDEIRDFWTDVSAAALQNAPDYFLGTIVLTQQGKPPRDTIIDGQQRLATMSILLAAIRDVYAARGEDKRAAAVQLYLSETDLKTATETPKLVLNSDDCDFFEQRVINGKDVTSTKTSHELIAGAYSYLTDQVNKLVDAAGKVWGDKLFELVTYLSTKVRAMVLKVPTDTDAFLVFETLNDRGADLTIADLLKNYLFGHAGDAKLDSVRDGWMQTLGLLDISAENEVFTTFIRHYWSSKHGLIRERDLYGSIKEHVTTPVNVSAFMTELMAAAQIYAALLNSDHDYWDDLGTITKENRETLERFALAQNRPLLLAALQHFSKDEVKKLFQSLVSWSVRGLIVGGLGSGTAEKIYSSAAVKIRNGGIKGAADVLKELAGIVPSDDDFQHAFAIARVPKASLARYYLLAMERKLISAKEPEFVPNKDEEAVNLEHVLPKKATDKDWGKAFDVEERKAYLFRLGNLALLQKGPNGKIGSKPFSVKAPILKASHFKLTSTIGTETDWTKAQITARQVELAKLAVSTWPR